MASGRIRSLKPEWLEDERLASVSDTARMVSVALILLSDDYGNGRAHPMYLASRVWPYSSRDPREMLASLEGALSELVSTGFVLIYTVNGQQCFSVKNWRKHQRVDKPSRPQVPGPDKADKEAASPASSVCPGETKEHPATPSRGAREVLGADWDLGLGGGKGRGEDRARAPDGFAEDPDEQEARLERENGDRSEPPTDSAADAAAAEVRMLDALSRVLWPDLDPLIEVRGADRERIREQLPRLRAMARGQGRTELEILTTARDRFDADPKTRERHLTYWVMLTQLDGWGRAPAAPAEVRPRMADKPPELPRRFDPKTLGGAK